MLEGHLKARKGPRGSWTSKNLKKGLKTLQFFLLFNVFFLIFGFQRFVGGFGRRSGYPMDFFYEESEFQGPEAHRGLKIQKI